MRALVVEELAAEYAGCRVKDLPDPKPGPGEVLVRVRAGAVNFPDLMQTRGEHQHKPPVPFVPGMELAGDVEAATTAAWRSLCRAVMTSTEAITVE